MDGIDSYILLQSIAYLGPQKNKQRSFESFEEADEMHPKDKLMQQNLALPVIAQLEQQMEKLKIEKRMVKIEPLVKKGLLIVFTGCSTNIPSKEWMK